MTKAKDAAERNETPFRLGQRVRLNSKAYEQGLVKRSNTGTIQRINGKLITVLLDGYKTPGRWHYHFFDMMK